MLRAVPALAAFGVTALAAVFGATSPVGVGMPWHKRRKRHRDKDRMVQVWVDDWLAQFLTESADAYGQRMKANKKHRFRGGGPILVFGVCGRGPKVLHMYLRRRLLPLKFRDMNPCQIHCPRTNFRCTQQVPI